MCLRQTLPLFRSYKFGIPVHRPLVHKTAAPLLAGFRSGQTLTLYCCFKIAQRSSPNRQMMRGYCAKHISLLRQLLTDERELVSLPILILEVDRTPDNSEPHIFMDLYVQRLVLHSRNAVGMVDVLAPAKREVGHDIVSRHRGTPDHHGPPVPNMAVHTYKDTAMPGCVRNFLGQRGHGEQ